MCFLLRSRDVKFVLFAFLFIGMLSGCADVRQGMPVMNSSNQRDIPIPPDNFQNLVKLIDHPSDDRHPEASPDGKLVAYTATKGKTSDIFYFDPNAKRINVTQVTRHVANDMNPAWSRDGKYLFFSSARLNTLSIWRTKIKGGRGLNQISLRENMNDFDPSISPTARKMVFSSSKASPLGSGFFGSRRKAKDPTLWTSDLGGYRVVQIGSGWNPKWSPDGKKILFHAMSGDNYDIWMIDADGTNLTQITTDSSDDVDACWSPDGKKIAFSSNREGTLGLKKNFDIWALDLLGSGITQLTFNPGNDGAPFWAKNGVIYFHSDRDNKNGTFDIFSGTPLLDWE